MPRASKQKVDRDSDSRFGTSRRGVEEEEEDWWREDGEAEEEADYWGADREEKVGVTGARGVVVMA